MNKNFTLFQCGKYFHMRPKFFLALKLVLLLGVLLTVTKSFAQTFQVKGKVTDERGEGIAGVSVKAKTGTVSSTTRKDGTYVIGIANGNVTLTFSFVGFVAQEIAVNGRRTIDVVLKEGSTTLDETVIVAYGQQKKITLSGAVSTIKADDLKQPVANLTNVLAGRVAGIIGVQRSGQPGYDNSEIYIRGISTFTSSSPLILVDGVQRKWCDTDRDQKRENREAADQCPV